MKTFISIFIIIRALVIVFKLLSLAASDYPRKRSDVKAWEDVLGLVFAVAFGLWAVYLLDQLQ
jgi:hypothetical protein